MGRLIACLCALLWVGTAAAQTWTQATRDNGYSIWSSVQSGVGLGFYCTGPSKGGLDVVTAQAHESVHTVRGELVLEITQDRLPIGNAYQRVDVVIWVAGTGYQLPPVSWNELDGVWQVKLSARDALVAALQAAPDFTLAASGEQAWSFQTTGLAAAMGEALRVCEAAYAGQGPAFTPSREVLDNMARAHIRKGCEGGYTQEDGAIQSALIDQDEVEDIVVHWARITCRGAFARPYCGASHCSANVFLSSRAGQRPYDLLTQALSLTPLSNGRMGLSIVGRFDSCGPNSLGCERIWFWNGADLVELAQ